MSERKEIYVETWEDDLNLEKVSAEELSVALMNAHNVAVDNEYYDTRVVFDVLCGEVYKIKVLGVRDETDEEMKNRIAVELWQKEAQIQTAIRILKDVGWKVEKA